MGPSNSRTLKCVTILAVQVPIMAPGVPLKWIATMGVVNPKCRNFAINVKQFLYCVNVAYSKSLILSTIQTLIPLMVILSLGFFVSIRKRRSSNCGFNGSLQRDKSGVRHTLPFSLRVKISILPTDWLTLCSVRSDNSVTPDKELFCLDYSQLPVNGHHCKRDTLSHLLPY